MQPEHGRNLIQIATLDEFKKNPNFAKNPEEEATANLSLYPGWKYNEYAWGMAIDLNRCVGCNACVPVRIVAPDFVPGRSLRRVAARNADVTVRIAEPKASVEQFRVFARYQHSRHHDSEMASMTYGDYRAMIEDSPVTTRLVELRGPDQRILGGCLVDLLDDGLSAVYSFYDPSDQRRGLGTYLILALIEETLRRQKPYVYLGYWIAESPKMAYKARFRPLEALSARGWNAMEA